MRFRLLALVFTLALPCHGGALPMRLISAPSVSPDGKQVVFEWCEDLWIASSEGGEARRWLEHPGRDAYPRFTPDGKRIVFSSDRSGSMQVYSRSMEGGDTVQHTHHTEGNELECLGPEGREAVVRGIRERSGFRATRLMAIDLTEVRRERRLFDATAHSPAWSPDGRILLFCRGGEALYRKGYRGSRASRIWSFKPADGSFRLEIPGDFEARSPMWLPDGSGFYFVSNSSGTANLWIKREGDAARPLTFHQGDGIISPDLSADGSTLVFRRGDGVFRMHPGRGPEEKRIDFHTHEPLPDLSTETRVLRGCDDADFMPGRSSVVFSAGGELWCMDGPGSDPHRLTETPMSEDQPRISSDGEWLYHFADDGLRVDLRRARIRDGKLVEITALTQDGLPKRQLKLSPDGRRIAWTRGLGDVYAANADGTDARLLHPGWDQPSIEWSPDGRWLAIAAENRDADREILLARADGSAKPIHLTRKPGPDGAPKWSPDGRWLLFTAERGGSGKTELWRMDFGRGGIGPSRSEASLMRAADAAIRLPTHGIEPDRVIWSPDSKRILFQSRSSKVKELASMDVDGGDFRILAKQRGVPIRMEADGSLLWRVGRRPEVLRDGVSTAFPIEIRFTRRLEDGLRLGFRRIWRTLGTRFHDPRMNGADWQALLGVYEAQAVSARTSRQFDAVVSRLMGELNASHLSFVRKRWPGESVEAPTKEKNTAFTGMIFEDRPDDPSSPLILAEVLPGSPLAEGPNPPRKGDRILRIGGQEVSHGSALHELLNGAGPQTLPIQIQEPDGNQRVVEARCISYQKARTLDAAARDRKAAREVSRALPETAYVRVPNMSRDSLETLQTTIFRASQEHSRLILDLRNNGGGREADRMLNLFTQVAHSFTVPRDGPRGYPADRRTAPAWGGPLVVLCNEHTFSNSEIFCHAIRICGRAPLVGMPTAGGVISAVSTPIPDLGSLQVPFRSWFHAGTGRNLDLNGAQPDHRIDLGPDAEHAGTDPQLREAIRVIEGLPKAK